MNLINAISSLAATPAAPQPLPADIDGQLSQVQAEIKGLQDRYDSLDAHRKQGQRECARYTERCNEIYNQVQPLYTKEARLIKINTIARYAGLGGSGMLGLGPGLLTFAPIAGMCVFGATVAVLGAAFLATERTRRELRAMRPQIDSLTQTWKYYEQQLKREQRDVDSDGYQIRGLEPQIKAARGREEVLLVARGITRVPTPDTTVKEEEDAVVIGTLRVPKRSEKAEKMK